MRFPARQMSPQLLNDVFDAATPGPPCQLPEPSLQSLQRLRAALRRDRLPLDQHAVRQHPGVEMTADQTQYRTAAPSARRG